jgi:serine/threonine-protein kinase
LGAGGQAAVYEVKTEVGQIVALKTPHPQHSDPRSIARFRQEAEVMARFKHPHLVQLYAWGEHDGWPFFTMPVYRGGTLRSRLAEFQAAPERAVAVMVNVAEAVHYLHSRGAVHRDLKPNNVLLDEAGEPHLSDFGLVKFVGDSTDSSLSPLEETKTGCVQGTPPYMPPEQAAGANRAVGPHWDVWSLGVMLYELLTGQRPYEAPDADVLLRLINTSDPPRPRSLKPSLDPELEAIILACLQREPTAEYASAALVAARLRAWLAKQKLPGWLSRHRWKLTAAGACLTAAAAALLLREPGRSEVLDRVRARLARGEAVDLLTAHRGAAVPWRVVVGQEASWVRQTPTGPLAVDSTGAALIELMDDPGVESYRFRVTVARVTDPNRSDPTLGLYFAHRRVASQLGDAHFFAGYWFREPLASLPGPAPGAVADVGPPPKRAEGGVVMKLDLGPIEPPHGSREAQLWGLYLHPDGSLRTHKSTPIQKRPYPLEGATGRHVLEVTADATGYRLSWDGQPAGKLKRPVPEGNIHNIDHQLAAPADPPLDFAPRGGLGLYVEGGSASFESAELTPLPPGLDVSSPKDPAP